MFFRNATIKLDQTDNRLKDMTDWPEFHNGVAAGLKIAPGISKVCTVNKTVSCWL